MRASTVSMRQGTCAIFTSEEGFVVIDEDVVLLNIWDLSLATPLLLILEMKGEAIRTDVTVRRKRTSTVRTRGIARKTPLGGSLAIVA